MKINFKGFEYDVRFNENGNMFSLESEGDVEAYCCARVLTAEPNHCWMLMEFLPQFVAAGIVKTAKSFPNIQAEECDESSMNTAIYCEIIHPDFNDDGFSPFGDFCRGRLGQQCQYGSRYIDGKLEGYPNLGEGLRFNNGKRWGRVRELDTSDYHFIRIHRDDMDEFERRYRAYQEERLNG